MFQFLHLAVAGLFLNLFYVLEIIDHESSLQVRFTDNREPLTITGDDVATVRTALQPAMLMELGEIQCRCCAEDSPPDLPPEPPGDTDGPQDTSGDDSPADNEPHAQLSAADELPAANTDHARDQASLTE